MIYCVSQYIKNRFLEGLGNNFTNIKVLYNGVDRKITKFPDKCFPAPAMKPWIWPKQSQQVYEKNKLCSFISSTKTMIPGHQFRTHILKQVQKK